MPEGTEEMHQAVSARSIAVGASYMFGQPLPGTFSHLIEIVAMKHNKKDRSKFATSETLRPDLKKFLGIVFWGDKPHRQVCCVAVAVCSVVVEGWYTVLQVVATSGVVKLSVLRALTKEIAC